MKKYRYDLIKVKREMNANKLSTSSIYSPQV